MIILSKETMRKAELDYKPYAKVLMFSGGTDSLAALAVCLKLGIKLDFIVHVNTRTGINETTQYCRSLAESVKIPFLEGDADTAYEDRLMRKGFFGRGHKPAHNYAYRILKATQFRKVISRNIRHGKRNRPILMINGARRQESKNRKHNFTEEFNVDPAAKNNIWTNIILDWSKFDCLDIIDNVNLPINPVAQLLHRSGECMCGTMQSLEDRRMASFFYPEWGNWLDSLEKRVTQKFPWGWGENVPKGWKKSKEKEEAFTPMCQSCIFNEKGG